MLSSAGVRLGLRVAGSILLIFAAAQGLGIDRTTALLAAFGIGLLIGSTGWGNGHTVPHEPTWSVRHGVASAIALGALALIWWGWYRFGTDAAASAQEIMDSMFALITAVLGYLFGRGEAANAEKVADQARTLAGDAADSASSLEPNANSFLVLAEWAKRDAYLADYVTAARRNVEEAGRENWGDDSDDEEDST